MANTDKICEELRGLIVQIGQVQDALISARSGEYENYEYKRSHLAPVDSVYVSLKHVYNWETSIVSDGLEYTAELSYVLLSPANKKTWCRSMIYDHPQVSPVLVLT